MAAHCQHCASPLEDTWRYCVRCGASTARLELPGSDVELASISMQRGGISVRRTITLRNRGVSVLGVRVRLEGAPSWIRLVTAGEIRVEPMGASDVALEVTPPASAAASHRFQLLVEHDDGPRSPIEGGRLGGVNWNLRNGTTSTLHLRIEIAEQADIRVEQEVLVFSQRINERTLTLRNANADEVTFALLAPEGLRAGRANGGQFAVPGRNGTHEGRLDIPVSVDPARWRSADASKPRELVVATEETEHHVRVHLIENGGTTAAVPLVIGVDFGTDNTSVFARIPGAGAAPEPVPILGSHEARVPSYVAYEGDSAIPKFFGRDAKDLLSQPERLQQDYRIEYDVKRWLRFANDDRSRRTVLRDFLKRLYLDIEAYLAEKEMASYAGIKFVFTLPVLDQSELYSSQRDVMRSAILEAFGPRIQRGITSPEDFVFVTEPQAAAACFLFDEAVLTEMGLPGYETNDLVAVVDSGAGTTDLALVRVTGKEGIDRFEVLAVRGTDLTDVDEGDLGVFGGRWVDEQLYDLMVGIAADGIRRAYPDAHATPESMRSYLEGTLQRAGLDHTAPEKYVEMVKPRLFTKVHASHKVQLRQVPLIRERALDPAIDTSRYLPSYAVTVGDFDSRLRQAGVLDRLIQALDGMMTEGEAGERIQRLPPEQRHLRYIFAVGGNSHLPQLVQALKERFPGAAVLPGEGSRARTAVASDELDTDSASIRMIAVARGSVWSVGHDLAGLLPFRLTLRAAGQGEVVLLRENSPFTMQLPVQTFLVRPSQPYEAEVRVHLDGTSRRIGLVRYAVAGASDALVRRSLHFELNDAWVLSAVVHGGSSPEEVLRLGLY
jgi:hypothetical protein